MMIESKFEFEYTHIAAVMSDCNVQIWRPSELRSFYYNFHFKNEVAVAVVFLCVVQCVTNIFFSI